MSLQNTLLKDHDHSRPAIKQMAYGKADWDDSTPELAALKQAHLAITNGSDVIHNNIRAILADETIMPAARFLRAGEFAEKTAKTIEARVEAAREPVKKKLRELQAHLESQLMPSPSAGHAVRDQEIRAHFASLKGEDKMRRADEALKSGDMVTVRALLTAPSYLTGLNEKTQQRIRADYLTRVAPEAMKLGTELERALAVVDRADVELTQWVSEALPWSDIDKMRKARLA